MFAVATGGACSYEARRARVELSQEIAAIAGAAGRALSIGDLRRYPSSVHPGEVSGLALSPDGSHPLQIAWLEHRVPQCGYCQAGQIMSAAALLDTVPDPDEDRVEDAMSGNLCRCGTYPRIRRAIRRVAETRS